MGIDALTALIFGRLFDKKGLLILISVPLLTIPIAPLFSMNFRDVLVGIILWVSVLGIQETIMKAAVANMIPIAKRGLVFGIFNATFGITWLLGSYIHGNIVQPFYFIHNPFLYHSGASFSSTDFNGKQ